MPGRAGILWAAAGVAGGTLAFFLSLPAPDPPPDPLEAQVAKAVPVEWSDEDRAATLDCVRTDLEIDGAYRPSITAGAIERCVGQGLPRETRIRILSLALWVTDRNAALQIALDEIDLAAAAVAHYPDRMGGARASHSLAEARAAAVRIPTGSGDDLASALAATWEALEAAGLGQGETKRRQIRKLTAITGDAHHD